MAVSELFDEHQAALAADEGSGQRRGSRASGKSRSRGKK
jgi:hypothetical protein